MIGSPLTTMNSTDKDARKREIFNGIVKFHTLNIDWIFARVLLGQWILAIVLALFNSPFTWNGNLRSVHPHVYLAVFFGGLLSLYPWFVVKATPGTKFSRYVIAISQTLFSILFIHITNGRIETHFHIFVSLAFLAAYYDVKVIAIATVMTALDHLLRGIYLPESVYGVISASPFRALEHSGWVLFEDLFLLYTMKISASGIETTAEKQADLEFTLANVETIVLERTKELRESQQTVMDQQQTLIATAKMSALGEMAGGIAHEINTPLGAISLMTSEIDLLADEQPVDKAAIAQTSADIRSTVDRIGAIVRALKTFARDSQSDPVANVSFKSIANDTLRMARERLRDRGIRLIFDETQADIEIPCRPTEIAQILLNLLNNSTDAVENLSDKWIKLECVQKLGRVYISVTDSGSGIPDSIRGRLMQPFFTTKEIGKGTGLGLSISRSIAGAHKGELSVDTQCQNTRFVLELPSAA